METRLKEIASAQGLQGAIHFEGHVAYDGLAAYYRRASLFVLPSLEDTFGMVVAEAAEFGLPIVVSKFAGAAEEFVRAGENGFVIDPTETAALAAAILDILQDEGRRKSMGAISLLISATKTLDQSAEEFALAIHRAAIQRERGGRP
jgi:glycosyltransferase involved in cell wall biosynthesis